MSSALQQHGEWQSPPSGTASPSSTQGDQPCQTGFLEFVGFIWGFNGLWTPAASPVTARYWVSVIIRSLIVKWAPMKRAGSPRGRLRYWRNGSQRWGQLPRTGTHTPALSNWPGRKSGHCSLWFCWDHREVGLVAFMMFRYKHVWAVGWIIEEYDNHGKDLLFAFLIFLPHKGCMCKYVTSEM